MPVDHTNRHFVKKDMYTFSNILWGCRECGEKLGKDHFLKNPGTFSCPNCGSIITYSADFRAHEKGEINVFDRATSW
jgi:predicted RNA-binding Zn-ribbon protein involved in translation (DUF1610 family)